MANLLIAGLLGWISDSFRCSLISGQCNERSVWDGMWVSDGMWDMRSGENNHEDTV